MAGESSHFSSVADLARLAQLLEEYRPQLLVMLMRRLDPRLARRVDAEDILTEAFLQARRRWAEFRQSDRAAYPWLYRITLDCLIEAWRREARQCRDLEAEVPWPEESSVQLGLGLVQPGTSPTQAAVREELRRRMRQVMELLPAKDREVLWMKHEDGLSHAQTGEVLGISANAATVRYVRALRRLKELWQRLNPGSEFSS
jgi:RNA polymerase sigma-70 factor (ECF subfamily)